MSKDSIIILLIIAIILSKSIIVVLIKYLLKKNRQLNSERLNLGMLNRELEESLAKVKAQEKELRDAELFKLKVFSIASHDLRIPFNNLKSLLTYIESVEDTENLRDILFNIRNQASASSEMLDNVLLWTTGQLQDVDSTVHDFSIQMEINKTIMLFEKEIMEKQIDVFHTVPDTLRSFGNMDVFNFVFRNLVSNAIKYSPEKSRIEIGVTESEFKDPQSLYIRDYGEGMDQQAIQKVLNGSFSRSKNTSHSSMGIGLSLSHDLMRRAGWDLSIESKINEGTKLNVVMPLTNN